jgi:hypothetical protein
MNRTAIISLCTGLLPMTLMAAGTQTETPVATARDYSVPAYRLTTGFSLKEGPVITPIDLEEASREYDIVLPQQPVKIQADTVYFRNSDGFVRGRGNVDLYQGSDEMHADYVEGNAQTQLFYVPGNAVWIQNGSAMNGTGILYNGKTRSASADAVSGFVDKGLYIRGTEGEMYNGQGYIKKGLITTPHAVAKTPDYYLTGDDIHVYPGDKFTSENTKLWFKHMCVLTYGHYEGSLKPEDHNRSYLFSLLPRPDYSSENGFGVYGGALFPIHDSDTLKLRINYALYTDIGFKPTIQLEKSTRYGWFSFGYHTEESTLNNDHIWSTQFPQLTYVMPRLNFGQTGIYVDNGASIGRWAESGIETGNHKDFHTRLSHEPIRLWNGANIQFYAGYRKDLYSTDDAVRRDPYSGVNLGQRINERVWTNWWYTKHNLSGYSPYRFDTIDHPRQKGVSVGYAATPRDTFILTLAKDLDTKKISDRNFTWVRDLHSFSALVTYKQVDKEWEVHVRAKDF